MEYRRFGNTELTVSTIGFGGATFGREITRSESFALLDHAFARGITFIDTSEGYSNGASEEILGEWIAKRGVRDKIVLATKVSGELTPARILDSAELSLRRLRTDIIDVFCLHNWVEQQPLAPALEALDQLVKQGKVRYLGCSNFNDGQLRETLDLQSRLNLHRLSAAWLNYSIVRREIEHALLPTCTNDGVAAVAYSPLGAGFLTGKYKKGAAVPVGTRFDIIPGHQDVYFDDASFQLLEAMRWKSQRTGIPLPQLALAWALSRPNIATVLIGGRTTNHIDQAFAAEQIAIPDYEWIELLSMMLN